MEQYFNNDILTKIKERFDTFCELSPAEGLMRFRDPISHLPLETTGAPSCITKEDSRCKEGFETLESLGRNLNIDLLFSYHRNSADFQGIVENPLTRRILDEASYVAMEANADATGQGIALEPEETGRGRFQRAQLQWLIENDKLTLPCDIAMPVDPKPAAGNLRKLMSDIWDTQELVNNTPTLPDHHKKQLCSLIMLFYQSVREEMMVGQLGYWLGQLEKRNMLSNERITVPFMVGSLHTPLVKKFNRYGIEVNAHTLQPTSERRQVFSTVVEQGYVTFDQLEVFAHS